MIACCVHLLCVHLTHQISPLLFSEVIAPHPSSSLSTTFFPFLVFSSNRSGLPGGCFFSWRRGGAIVARCSPTALTTAAAHLDVVGEQGRVGLLQELNHLCIWSAWNSRGLWGGGRETELGGSGCGDRVAWYPRKDLIVCSSLGLALSHLRTDTNALQPRLQGGKLAEG